MSRPINTLHIDIEGGWGGSSRSLFELLSRLDQNVVRPLVVHRKRGPIEEKYRSIGIATVHVPEIVSYVPRNRALLEFALQSPAIFCSRVAAKKILDIAQSHDCKITHLNYEGLWLLGRQLKSLGIGPTIVHCRASRVSNGLVGRLMARSIAKIADKLFFISPQEQHWFEQHVSDKVDCEVLWNISPIPLPRAALTVPPRAIYLGNIDPSKGVHRLIDVAEELENRNAPPLQIQVYGQARNSFRYRTELQSAITSKKLSHRLQLAGYTNDPLKLLSTALVLVRPSMWEDPWGRDVIEATTAGCPVISTGTYEGVIKQGETGFLISPFDAGEVADRMIQLLSDSNLHSRMSAAASAFGAKQFLGEQQSEQFTRAVTALTNDCNEAITT